MFADVVLSNGKVVTVVANESIAEAVAIKFGRILAVGSNEQIKSLIGSETEVIDLKGRTMIPGLLESHCHISTAEGLQRTMGIIDASQEGGVKSLVDILAKIAQQAKKKPKGEWINVAKEDESKLVEKTHPQVGPGQSGSRPSGNGNHRRRPLFRRK